MIPCGIIFPGQGSQSIGMLSELGKNHSIIKTTFSEASSVLNYDLWKLIQFGTNKELNKTWLTQPALLASSVAIWRLWRQYNGYTPMLLAGHSLGEYSALVCAGSLNFATAIKLVTSRGKFMQEAVPPGTGAMSVIIGLNQDIVSKACIQASENQIVSPGNFNAPKQIVITGHKEAVQRAMIVCKAAGAKRTMLLPISAPSHCILMKPAAEKLAKELDLITFLKPKIPIINNVNVSIEYDPSAIRLALKRQLYNPVRWSETIKLFTSYGIKLLIEMGPGKVLTGINKRNVNTISSISINDSSSLFTAIKQ